MSISSNAMIVELNIGNWTANKLDKQVSEEVDASKGTKTRAGNYRKNLFAGSKDLEAINKFVANVRNWHYRQTLPWLDSGPRLLPLKRYVAYSSEINALAAEFDTLKRNFVTKYPDLISEMAFSLGDLFNRDEYPSPDAVDRKFYFTINYYPLPDSGDFRVDVGNESLQELQAQYSSHYEAKLNEAMADAWNRLHTALKHMSERLANSDSGEKKIIRESMLGNAQELCGMLSDLNVANDPKLEEARKDLERAIMGVSTQDLRESVLVRQDVHARVSDILKKFDI